MKPNKKMTPNKAKNFKKAWGSLLNFLKPYYAPILISLLFAIGGTILTLLGPRILQQVLEEISLPFITLGPINMELIMKLISILIVFYSVAAILQFTQSLILAKVTQKTSVALRSDIATKINRLPLKYYDKTTHGEVLSRVTNDVDTINTTLSSSIAQTLTSTTMFVGTVILMFIASWQMATTVILASLIGFIFMGLIMARSQKYFVGQQKSLAKVNGHIEEIYSGHRVVKVSNAENLVRTEFEQLNSNLHSNVWKSQFFSGLMNPLMNFIANFAYVATAIVGLALIITGHITSPLVIVTFIFYVRFFTQTLTQFAQVGNNIQAAAAASERVFEFLEEEELSDESHITGNLLDVKGRVRFENVKFGYEQGKTIINNFSATAKAGDSIAIVGPTGAGKTTIVNLLMKFYDIDSGEIYIDDIPISNLTRSNIHNTFGMVLQDTWIFKGSVRDNIIYNQKHITDDQLIEATKAVGLHHFIMTLPGGYDAILDDTISLSEGQNQLLTIARAMIRNAPMLILDEATSSVDTRTEQITQKAMNQLMEGRTSFVIAHRLSTIVNADMILVMKDGDIIEQGNHANLIKQNGFYTKLYNSQFEE